MRAVHAVLRSGPHAPAAAVAGGVHQAHVLAHTQVLASAGSALLGAASTLPAADVYGIGGAVFVVGVGVAALVGRRSGRRALAQRLTALGSRLGIDTPDEHASIESALSYLEQVTGAATEAVADTSADAIRLRRSLDTFPQGVVLCDESGAVVYRNTRANALMASRHGDALAAQAVTELLEDAWDRGAAERTLDLYGPPRRTLTVRARLIDDGRRPLGVIAVIEDVSERRRLEEIRRDFVANVSHELKTPMGALGLLAETLVAEPDVEVGRRLASRIHTEAFRVSRIIDDLLDLSRIESEAAPPREPVLVNLVMAEAVERVRSSADQRGITITLEEPDPPVAVHGDRRQLVSAMHALIENAVTYSYDGSTVAVTGLVAPGALATAGEAPYPPVEPGAGAAAGLAPVASTVVTTVGALPASSTSATPSQVHPASAAVSLSGSTHSPEGGASSARPEASARSGGASGSMGSPGSASEPGAGGPAGATSNGSQSPIATAGDEGVLRSEAGVPSTSRDTVRISVTDHGVGIPARDLDRIFERFYRVDHGRSRETGGTGLGLAIVRHVATNHQGWVEVESREGEGSTFTLVLPLQADRHT
jgi:two-component system, OmpR family, sensor histidine kinase SenX3